MPATEQTKKRKHAVLGDPRLVRVWDANLQWGVALSDLRSCGGARGVFLQRVPVFVAVGNVCATWMKVSFAAVDGWRLVSLISWPLWLQPIPCSVGLRLRLGPPYVGAA